MILFQPLPKKKRENLNAANLLEDYVSSELPGDLPCRNAEGDANGENPQI